MIIIAGLGNPGEKFNHTRHNAGFMAVDFFAEKNSFPEFKLSKKFHSFISEKNSIFLVKPETFMNESGRGVQKITAHYKLPGENLVVVRDDIDLPLGKIKFSENGGAGGHKGVESIIQQLGNNHFVQLKIGIATDDKKAEDVVLKKFSKEEQEILANVVEKSAKALDYFTKNGLEETMNEYNR